MVRVTSESRIDLPQDIPSTSRGDLVKTRRIHSIVHPTTRLRGENVPVHSGKTGRRTLALTGTPGVDDGVSWTG